MRSLNIKWLALATSIGMFIVLVNGALVTKTESGRGCGDDWPLCNGKFVPAYTLESMIEYSHRAITGIVGILVLLTFIAVYRAYGRRTEQYRHASGIAFFTVLQAILGAMAVKWEQSSAVMALHFGFSMIAFTFTVLLLLVIRREGRAPTAKPEATSTHTVDKRFRLLVWVTTIYSYIVVYIGAFVRHTDSSGGCEGWPLCNGKVIPELTGAEGIAFIHRIAGLLLFILLIWLAVSANRHYRHIVEVRRIGNLALLLVVLQVISGAFVVTTLASANWYVLSSLIHTGIIAVLFSALSYLCIRVWQLRNR